MEKPAVLRYAPDSEYFFAEGCYITELANGPGDADVSVARARLEAGNTTRWHRLRGISERYVIIAGSGVVEVEGLAASAVEPNDMVLIPPGAGQRICNTGDGDLVFLAICSPRFEAQAYVDAEDELSSVS
ncbi:MAG: cupin domain-containing protein [Halioglobus sp.]|nr:cupin domain-containing protein [Halioglobus sp.]